MAQLNFNANGIDPQASIEPIPEGHYNAMITASDIKPTKSNDGAYLELELTVMDGQYANRKLFDRLNLQNANQVAVEIAQRRLSAYCHATGVMMVSDSSMLHGIPMKVKVVIKKDPTGAYEPKNEIRDIKNVNEQVGAIPQQPQGFGPPSFQKAPPPPPVTQQFAPPQFAPPQAPPQQQFPQQQPQFAQPPQQQFAPPSFAPPTPQQPPQVPPGGGYQPPSQAPQADPGAKPPWMR